MASLREIRNRIKSVRSSEKITKAMTRTIPAVIGVINPKVVSIIVHLHNIITTNHNLMQAIFHSNRSEVSITYPTVLKDNKQHF